MTDPARPVAAWAPLSAGLAPVALVGGWTLAAAAQPVGYDPLTQTISALAATGAAHRWLMTAALVVVGLCHLATAAGLRPVRPAARLVLAVAGLAGLGVAAFPQPASGSSPAHVLCATVSIAALAVWPATLARRRGPAPLTPPVASAATAVMAVLSVWLGVQLDGGATLGLAERALTATEAVWPLVVVLALRRAPAAVPARMSG